MMNFHHSQFLYFSKCFLISAYDFIIDFPNTLSMGRLMRWFIMRLKMLFFGIEAHIHTKRSMEYPVTVYCNKNPFVTAEIINCNSTYITPQGLLLFNYI